MPGFRCAPINGVKVAGLVPRAHVGDTHVRDVEDSIAVVYFDMRNSEQRREEISTKYFAAPIYRQVRESLKNRK